VGIETIIGLAALVISAIAGAFGLGHIRGTESKLREKLSLIPEVRTQSLLWTLTVANIEDSIIRMDNS